jgi:hypothetical protein
MTGKITRVIQQLECPIGKGKPSLLVEWETDKGKKVLRSISCDNPALADYSGEDCDWQCWEKVSRDKQ